jgi:AmmeMemoRadiSam system protein A
MSAPSTPTGAPLSDATRAWLVALARSTVRAALADGDLHLPDPHDVPPDAAAPGAAFVTLRRDGRLLGCIGSLEPVRSLADDVAAHAYDAAFRDPRLPAVTLDDWTHMDVEVSVLGPLQRVDVHDRDELAAALRPGIDGVLLTSREGRGTFLPSVWGQIGSTDRFLDELWRKAGLHRRRWPDDLVVERYQVDEFGDGFAGSGSDQVEQRPPSAQV